MLDGLGEDDEPAKSMSEFIEKLHEVQNHKLIVLAPHGGNIEPWTDVEAEYVAKQFGDLASLWLCKGLVVGNQMANPMKMHLTVGISLRPK